MSAERGVITASNRGIGLGLVRIYLDRGDQVFACCRRPSDAIELADIARERPDQCTVLTLDVTSRDQVEAAVERVGQLTDAVDLVVNNAGVFFPSRDLADLDSDTFTQSTAVNAVAPMIVSRAFLPLLEAGRSPSRIVNITAPTRPLSSTAATVNHTYLASRYALNALARIVAGELASRGIVMVALWPGYLRTDMNAMDPEAAPPAEALPGVVDVMDHLDLAAAGTCLLPDGTTHPW